MRILMAMMDGRTVLMFGMSPFFVVNSECGLNFKNIVAKNFPNLKSDFGIGCYKIEKSLCQINYKKEIFAEREFLKLSKSDLDANVSNTFFKNCTFYNSNFICTICTKLVH